MQGRKAFFGRLYRLLSPLVQNSQENLFCQQIFLLLLYLEGSTFFWKLLNFLNKVFST